MNPGLRYLLAKGPTALVRRLRRRLRGFKGVATVVGIALLVILLVGPQVFRYLTFRDVEQIVESTRYALLFAPPAILIFILLTAVSGGLQFKPAEIQFLFPAPVGRRELLVYNALARLRVQVLSGVWLSIFSVAYAPHWSGAVIASMLVMAYLQLAAQTIGLALATVEERFGPRVRRAILLAVAGLLLAVLTLAYRQVPDGAGYFETLESIASWPPIATVSWLTRPVVEVYVAQSAGGLLLWTATCVALLGLMIYVMTLFDLAFAESAIKRAQKVQQAIDRMRTGGSPFAARGKISVGRLHVPRLPFMAGAGPIAWRQLQELTRNYRSVIMMGAMMFLMLASFLIFPRIAAPEGAEFRGMPAPVVIGIIAFIMPMMSIHAAFDFRRDLSRMAVLKALPIPGSALALGQILPTALLMSAWELIAVVVIVAMGGSAGTDWPLLLAILPVLLPLNAALVGFDNILFLFMPYRIVAKDPGQMPFMPRLMLVMFLKMLLMLLLAALAAIPGVLVWMATESAILAGLAVAGLLTLVTWGVVYGVAAAFRAFDISRDIPD